MTFLAKEFYIDLTEEMVTSEQFAEAVKVVSRRNRFFPVMADILAAVDEQRRTTRPLIDISWKRNFPELLDDDERVRLGISREAVEAAKREQLPECHPLKSIIKRIAG